MKNRVYFVLLVFIFHSCAVSQSKREKQDKTYVNYILKNKDRIKNAAAFAIDHTWGWQSKEFGLSSVKDKKNRKLLAGFGSQINVYYTMMNDNVYDSTVTFKTIDFSGVHEIIYCFAARPFERTLFSNVNSALIKVTGNIYYTRRPFPIM